MLAPGLYTMPEAARRLGVSTATAYELDNAGRFPVPVVYVGAVRKVRVVQLEAFVTGTEPTLEGARMTALADRLRAERPIRPPALTLVPGGISD